MREVIAADASQGEEPVDLFDFNIIAGSITLFLLVGGYAWRQYSVAIGCMLVGVIGLMLLILYNIRASTG